MPHDLVIDPDTDLVLIRDIAAPPAKVYACWTTPEHLMQWFVPRPHRVIACTMAVRVGGRFDTTFDVAGQIIENTGVFLELVPDTKLVFTDTYSAGWKPAPEPFLTAVLTFEAAGHGRTRYTAVARHRTKAAAENHRDMGFHDGWGTATDQLEAYAATF